MKSIQEKRGLKRWVGKGDCYEANFILMTQMHNEGIDCQLVHGIITAPDWFTHMRAGTEFMHAWVEANHPKHGWTVCDASLCEGTDRAFTIHSLSLFYDGMKVKREVKMSPHVALMMFNKYGWFGNWDLHPSHGRCKL